MRSVNVRKSPRDSRTGPVRRTVAKGSRPSPQRRGAGGRGGSSEPVVAAFLQGMRERFHLRRPVIWFTLLILAITLVVALLAGGYVQRGIAAVGRSVDATAVAAGFGVSDIEVSGEHRAAEADIRNATGVAKGQSLFAVDVHDVRDRLRNLPWVQDAIVHKQFPGTLSVTVIEKNPFALWLSNDGKLYVIERSGAPIAQTDGQDFKRLPRFVGDPPEGGADLVDAIATHRAVNARMKGMQRISGRRWNLLLDDGVVVDLPEDTWHKQLDDLEHLIVDKGVLERDVREIDLRESGNYVFILRNGEVAQNVPGGI